MKIAVLLSGGVDSSTALWLLKRAGYTAIDAYYLKIWLEDELSYLGDCPWEEDLAYARAVCEGAGVTLHVVSLQLEYYERVVEYAVSELRAGRTPSPDIFCNQRIKFGAFFDAAARLGNSFDKVATGHYARIDENAGEFLLKRAPDPVKDQTYFLSHLNQDQLARAMFPLGGLDKRAVRRIAAELALPNRDRPDSQGICFLGKLRYPEFVAHYLGERPGDIVELETGRVLGRHRGYWFHTIGQRQGLGLGNGPWYVVRKDTGHNVIYVSHSSHAEENARTDFFAGSLTWIGRTPPDAVISAGARAHSTSLALKLRHGPDLIPCRIAGVDGGTGLEVSMERPDRGVAPGQFAVFYDGDTCLGSGMIEAERPDGGTGSRPERVQSAGGSGEVGSAARADADAVLVDD